MQKRLNGSGSYLRRRLFGVIVFEHCVGTLCLTAVPDQCSLCQITLAIVFLDSQLSTNDSAMLAILNLFMLTA